MKNTRKEELLSYLTELGKDFSYASEKAPSILSSVYEGWLKEFDKVSSSISQSDVFAPVVGGFSTGKSTALNCLIGRDILPEKVSPETALPTELRFSEKETILALSTNGEWSEFDINELAELSTRAESYQLVQVFVDSQVLKDIEPLVLVDMPGFDSGLDQHNQAILRYITTGALYLYMVSSKAGTVSRQDVGRIEEILDLGRSVKVFLTMTDLASPEELEATHLYVSEHMSFVTGDSDVGLINKDEIFSLLETLESANIGKLFDGLVLGDARNLYFDAISHINIAISAFDQSETNVKERIEVAESSLKKVENERDRMLTKVHGGQLANKTDYVMSKLEKKLNDSIDELVTLAKSGESPLAQSIGNIVRSTLSIEIQKIVRQITTDVAYHFSGQIAIEGISIGSNEIWVNDVISLIENEAMNALTGLNTSRPVQAGKSNGLMGGLSMAAFVIPNPVLKVVFAILPAIVGSLFNGIREQNQSNHYRQVICTQVIPRILVEVRSQVQDSLCSIEVEIIAAVSEKISAKVEAEKALYKNVYETSEVELIELRKTIDALYEIREKMNESAEGSIA